MTANGTWFFGVFALLTAFILGVSTLAHGQQPFEEIVVAKGGRYGEQPLVVGNRVYWRAYGKNRMPDTIQYRDLSRLGSQVVDVAPYLASRTGLVVTPQFVFRGASNGFPDGSPVLARPVSSLTEDKDFLVCDFGSAVAANEEFVFVKVATYEREPFRNKVFAKAILDLGNPSVETLKLVAELQDQTELSRTEAVSKRYFVWQDRDPSIPNDTWKIYAKRTEELFDPMSSILILDTNVYLGPPFHDFGVYLALHENLLFVQAAEQTSKDAALVLYLLNLDSTEPPIPIVATQDPETLLVWPDISKHYIVWTKVVAFTGRQAYALRLVDGRPEGEPFRISNAPVSGSWLTIDGNLAAWNGSTTFNEGEVVHEAIVVSELPLPGATDVGDVDQNGRLDITDPVLILSYLFRGGWQPRRRLADANGDGSIDLSDCIALLRHLFDGKPLPASP